MRNLLETIRNHLCKVGIHSWKLTRRVEYHPGGEIHKLVKKPARRMCTRCKKRQMLDEVCLGLNPPEYSSTWVTIKKRG